MSDDVQPTLVGFIRPFGLEATFLNLVYRSSGQYGVLEWQGDAFRFVAIELGLSSEEMILLPEYRERPLDCFEFSFLPDRSICSGTPIPLAAFLFPGGEIVCGDEFALREVLRRRLSELSTYRFTYLDVCEFIGSDTKAEEAASSITDYLNQLRNGIGDRWRELNNSHSPAKAPISSRNEKINIEEVRGKETENSDNSHSPAKLPNSPRGITKRVTVFMRKVISKFGGGTQFFGVITAKGGWGSPIGAVGSHAPSEVRKSSHNPVIALTDGGETNAERTNFMLALLQHAVDHIRESLHRGRRNDATELYRVNDNDTLATKGALLSAWTIFRRQLGEIPLELDNMPALAASFVRLAYNRWRKSNYRERQMGDQISRANIRDGEGEFAPFDPADRKNCDELVKILRFEIEEELSRRTLRDRMVIELHLAGFRYEKIVSKVPEMLPDAKKLSTAGVSRIINAFRDAMRDRLKD